MLTFFQLRCLLYRLRSLDAVPTICFPIERLSLIPHIDGRMCPGNRPVATCNDARLPQSGCLIDGTAACDPHSC
jgi:hypothetical protein